MNTLIIALSLLTAGPDVELRTVDGRTLSGSLAELSVEKVAMETAEGPAAFDAEKLLALSLREKPAAPAAAATSAWIEMIDGSVLLAKSYATKNGAASVALADGSAVEFPTRGLATVRLQSASDATAAEWARIQGMKLAGDVLVVKKDEAIDYHKGVLGDMGEKTADFELDGEKIPVKRGKIFGVIYYHAAKGEPPAALCTLTDASGSRWAVRSLALKDKEIEWTTPAGVTVKRPASSVASIDFSGGKIVYLSDLKPDASQYTPFFGTAKDIPSIAEFYAPRMDRGMSGKPLKVEGKQYDKGVAMKSRTEIAYRLPGKFTRLKALAGIDDEVRPHGNLRLVIRGDDRVLLETTIAGNEPAKPIDLEVTGVRRLTILADFGEEMDIADCLDLCLARICK